MIGSIIRNANVPICKMCKNLMFDVKYPGDYSLTKCIKFGIQCKVSGEITHLYAERCRRDSSMCGEEATHYDAKLREPSVPLYTICLNKRRITHC